MGRASRGRCAIILLLLQANLALANLDPRDEDAPGQPLPEGRSSSRVRISNHLLEFKLIIFMSSQIDHLLEFGFSTQSAYRVRILKPMIFSSSDPQVNHLL